MREAVLEFRRDLATRSFVTWSEIRREAALLGFYSLEAVREGEVTLEIRSWKRGELRGGGGLAEGGRGGSGGRRTGMNLEERLKSLEAFLVEARARGESPDLAWAQARRRFLTVPLPPTRYERGGSPAGTAYLVAVLERDGVEVDRVRVRVEAFLDWESLGAAADRLGALAEKANAVPLEERRPVSFLPWNEEETDRILEVVNKHLETDLEDYLGHYLGKLLGVAWK